MVFFLSKYEPVNLVVLLAPGCGDAMQSVGIGFERMGFALGVDHRQAFEFREKVAVVRVYEVVDSGEMAAVQRSLLKIPQPKFVSLTIRQDQHVAVAIVSDSKTAAPPLDFDILGQEPAKPLRRNAGSFCSRFTVARLTEFAEGGFQLLVGCNGSRANLGLSGSRMTTSL
jgi:hypothetical protein